MSAAALVAPVRWVGARRDGLAGTIAGRVDLRTLAGRPHLYALGPLEGCRGEASIFAGVPSIAQVAEHLERVRLAPGARLGFPDGRSEDRCESARATSSRDGSSRS